MCTRNQKKGPGVNYFTALKLKMYQMLPHSGVNARGHQVEARRWVRLDVPSVTRARKVALFWLVREVGPSVVRDGVTVKRHGLNYF